MLRSGGLSRRRYLLATAGSIGLAGCQGLFDRDPAEQTETDTETAEPTTVLVVTGGETHTVTGDGSSPATPPRGTATSGTGSTATGTPTRTAKPTSTATESGSGSGGSGGGGGSQPSTASPTATPPANLVIESGEEISSTDAVFEAIVWEHLGALVLEAGATLQLSEVTS